MTLLKLIETLSTMLSGIFMRNSVRGNGGGVSVKVRSDHSIPKRKSTKLPGVTAADIRSLFQFV